MYKLISILICVIFSAMAATAFISPNIIVCGESENSVIQITEKETSSNLNLHNKLVEPQEIELLSILVMAEAEGEPDKGKIFVIDTVLNRVDSDEFPDTIYDVIYQKNQFTSVWNGRFDRCIVDRHCCELIIAELKHRTNYDCIFFNAGHYSEYGTPMFSVGNHYFSKGDDSNE